MADVLLALECEVDAKWKHLGTYLYVDPLLIENIEKNNGSTSDCVLDLVTKWVMESDRTGDLPRTWQTVVEAVRLSGFRKLAQKLADKYGVIPHNNDCWAACTPTQQ